MISESTYAAAEAVFKKAGYKNEGIRILLDQAVDAAITDHLSPLREAIENEGTHPVYHRRTMARHRAEWPVIWEAIRVVLDLASWRDPYDNYEVPS